MPTPPRCRHGGRLRAFAAATFLALVPQALHAQRVLGVDAEIGTGRAVDMARIGVLFPWQRYSPEGRWQVRVLWDVQVGRWRSHSAAGGNSDLWDVSATPIVRLERTRPGRLSPFVEGAVGFHLLSRNHINNRIDMGSAFQFGDHVGAGVRFGPARRLELAYRHQHLSNASLTPPNDGINFNQLRAVIWF